MKTLEELLAARQRYAVVREGGGIPEEMRQRLGTGEKVGE